MSPVAVERALAALPAIPHVERLAFELGRDGGGQKALRIWVVFADDAPSLAWSPDARERLRILLRGALAGAGLRAAWAYVAFRSAEEQRALEPAKAEPDAEEGS